uniref:Family with sequence similarity 222 member B n=1 Tax=Sander lucioperca TaxID=283035 RepID=A0A8D0D8P6_SANLU
MLACLPASGDPAIRLLSRTQMNTGLQKWETTQKMRSANYPTPAELDAYAKKVANNPLTIQIFPNSVKVPQRKHIRRTVNGLDTSSSSQRHSPYPSQVSSSRGLLAVLRTPAKGVKESDASRARQLQKGVMNPHGGPYAAQSTLNLPQPAPHLQALQRQQSLSQVQTPQQRLAHPQGIQRQQGLPHTQALQQQQQQQQQQRGAGRRLHRPHPWGKVQARKRGSSRPVQVDAECGFLRRGLPDAQLSGAEHGCVGEDAQVSHGPSSGAQ